MPKKLTQEEFIYRFNNLNYEFLTINFITYRGMDKKIKVVDKKYGEWWVTPRNLLSKKRMHPKRCRENQKKPKITLSEVNLRISKVFGDTVSIDPNTYRGVSKTCRFIDRKYGEFFTSPSHVFHGHGHKIRGILRSSKERILPIKEVKKRLLKTHGDKIVISDETYISLYKKALFIHKQYGEWWATPNNVIRHGSSHPSGWKERSRNTSIIKYGTEYPMQNKLVFEKSARSCWRTILLKHWKTGQELLCRGSYEYAVVTKLNELHIDFEWQIKFILPENITYFCDLYLIQDNKYVEIKGVFKNEKNKKKWLLFNSTHKNSELWRMEDVQKFTGKNISKIKREFNQILLKKESKVSTV